jgi:hypothetical protein
MDLRTASDQRACANHVTILNNQSHQQDVMKWSDCIAEAIIDLDGHLKAAFVRGEERYQVFDDDRSKTRAREKRLAKRRKKEECKARRAASRANAVSIAASSIGSPQLMQPLTPETTATATVDNGVNTTPAANGEIELHSMNGECACMYESIYLDF